MNLDSFVCSESSRIFDAIKKIDANKKSFLIVINKDSNVIGTLTDGDIRRAIINGKNIYDEVSPICNRKFVELKIEESIGKAIELFKNSKIKFLPITKDGKLINIITKYQMQSLLLKDIVDIDLKYDFSLLDENIVNTEIFIRPWGFYKTTVLNDYYQSKVLTIKPNGKLSLQSHNHRDEYWIIVHGIGLATIGEESKEVKAGDTLYIPRNIKHRLENINDKQSLIVTEVQLGEYFGEDDIIRYEDIYNRV